MMLVGRITKAEGNLWVARCEAIGAITQGESRDDARSMLAELVQLKAQEELQKKITAEVSEEGDSTETECDVAITSADVGVLAALVLRHQREVSGLSLAEVAKKLGSSSRNSFAAYEQAQREPSLSKFLELLAVVAPDFAMRVGPRVTSSRGRGKRRSA